MASNESNTTKRVTPMIAPTDWSTWNLSDLTLGGGGFEEEEEVVLLGVEVEASD